MQLAHRTSHSSASLSTGVGEHLRFADSLPAFLQSWVANIATFMIHISDPRYSSIFFQILIVIILLFLLILPVLLLFSIPKKQTNNLKSVLALNLISFTILFGWYAVLAQHSYDHATYTFRSLVFWFGGFAASLLYFFDVSRNEWCARRDSNPKPSDP
jgi:uncharacterized membrane protein